MVDHFKKAHYRSYHRDLNKYTSMKIPVYKLDTFC